MRNILITDIDFIETPNGIEPYMLEHLEWIPPKNWNNMNPDEKEFMVRECERVYFQSFMAPNGNRIKIGICKFAAEILGLEYEAWENMENELDRVRGERDRLQIKCTEKERLLDQAMLTLKKWQTAGFWKRVKWLFTGIQ